MLDVQTIAFITQTMEFMDADPEKSWHLRQVSLLMWKVYTILSIIFTCHCMIMIIDVNRAYAWIVPSGSEILEAK